MKNREVSGLQGASQNVGYKIYKRFYLKKKLMCCQVTWMCSSAGLHALDRK